MEPLTEVDLRYPKAKYKKAPNGKGDVISPRYERIESDGIQAKRIVEYHPYVTTLVADPKEEEALGKEWVDSPSDVGKKVI